MSDRQHRRPTIDGRVLLVDDDASVLLAYDRLLRRLGCEVDKANSGEAALEILRVTSFDLVVSDIRMPQMSGTELLRAIRERGLDVPVILMTSAPGDETAVEAVDGGAFRYLAKPLDFDTFAHEVRGAIHTHAVARVLADPMPLREACRRIVRATCRGLDWDFAAIWMPEASGERLRCAETWSRPGGDAALFEVATRGFQVEAGQGPAGRAWAGGLPEWVPDLAAQSLPLTPLAVAAGFRSGFAVPFGAEGEVFAVVEFFSISHRRPDLVLLELLVSAGKQLAGRVLRDRADERAARAEKAERNISRTLDAIMECAPAFIIAVDEEGKIQFINRVLPNYKMEEVIGSHFLQYMPPSDHEQHREHLQRVLTTGIDNTYETTIVGPDGRTLWFSTHIGPLRNNDKVVGAVILAQEITQLKRTQAEVATAQRLATVGTMAAGIAHEINTPVQFVNDSVQFLRDSTGELFDLLAGLKEVRRLAAEGAPVVDLKAAIDQSTQLEDQIELDYLQENVPQAFERCAEGLERIKTIVRSMKEFTHPAQHDMAPTDLNRALQNTLTITRGEYKYVAELEVDLGDIPLVTCHVNDINQVVLNLVVNAAHAIGDVVKGTDQRGVITVRTRRHADDVVISIGDTGTGIPTAIGQRIFEPFFTTKEVGKGTGQGLALAWAMVKEKHGGELTFETKLGSGTTFFVRLPIAGKPSKRLSTAA